jgi:hypothetical protein
VNETRETVLNTLCWSVSKQAGDALLWENDALIHTATPSGLIAGQRLMWQMVVKRARDAARPGGE